MTCLHQHPPSHLQVHNKLNNTHMALMHFSWAMDLDPKGANSQIKDALDPTINNRAAGQEEAGGGGAAAASDSAAGMKLNVVRVIAENENNYVNVD